ncbi:MAG: TrkH family potassium uptake protein [Coriobacteriia bacterium]|nr:TrkH family potassium uptake protein [Coriobacteriia bacterium]
MNIAFYLGTLLLFLAATMLVPVIVSLVFAEYAIVAHYVVGIGFALAVGSALRLLRVSPKGLERRQAIAVTGLVWIVAAFVGAVPLWLSGDFASFFDAFFEAVSCFTATGLSLCKDIDHLSMGDQMWRYLMQFLGGQGVIVIALSLGIFSQSGSAFYTAEGREEFVMPYIKRTAQFIWRFSSIVVLAGTVVLTVVALTLGFAPLRAFFQSLWMTIGSYDTSGFAPQSLSVTYYHSAIFEFIILALMAMGALNFAIYARLWHGNWRAAISDFFRDLEIKTLAIWTLVMLVVFIATMVGNQYINGLSTVIRRGVFTVVSNTTNTGYQVFSNEQMSGLLTSGAYMILIISLAIGGSIGSTAGGIKALRVGIIAKQIVSRIKTLLLPASARDTTSYIHNGRRLITTETANAAMILTLLYMLSYLAGAVAGVVAGYEALPATLESVTAGSNAGLSSGILTPLTPAFLKTVYILQMWLGRLEFFTLLALFAGIISSLKPRRGKAKAKAKAKA